MPATHGVDADQKDCDRDSDGAVGDPPVQRLHVAVAADLGERRREQHVRVVTLIPPAVMPMPPPTNISASVSRRVSGLTSA